MAFSIYEVLEVVRVPCQSVSWSVYVVRGIKTNQLRD